MPNTLHRIFGSVVDPDAGTVEPQGDGVMARQPMRVINVGLPRTGTSSFVEAMSQLGLRSYHMKDGVQDTPGHASLWVAHAKLWNGKASDWNDASMADSREALFDRLAEDGFSATADMPMNAFAKDLSARYPDAALVLTEHHSGDPKKWAASVLETIGQNGQLFRKRPFTWIPFIQGFLVMEEWAWAGLGISKESDHSLDPSKLETLYTRWNEDVARYLESQGRKVLRFKATDGWGPLCDFLSSALNDVSITDQCDAIIGSGVAFPKSNTELRTVYAVMTGISAFFELPLPIVALIALVLLALVCKGCGYCVGVCSSCVGKNGNQEEEEQKED